CSADLTFETATSGTGGFFLRGTEQGEFLGWDALVGDIDGDERPELVIGTLGAPELEGGKERPGRVYIVQDIADLRGNVSVEDVDRVVTVLEGESPADRFGEKLVLLGDQDSDGFPELLGYASVVTLMPPQP